MKWGQGGGRRGRGGSRSRDSGGEEGGGAGRGEDTCLVGEAGGWGRWGEAEKCWD